MFNICQCLTYIEEVFHLTYFDLLNVKQFYFIKTNVNVFQHLCPSLIFKLITFMLFAAIIFPCNFLSLNEVDDLYTFHIFIKSNEFMLYLQVEKMYFQNSL